MLIGVLAWCRKAYERFGEALKDPTFADAWSDQVRAEGILRRLSSACKRIEGGSRADVERTCQEFREKLAAIGLLS